MSTFLGIDAGSVALSAVFTDSKGEILHSSYRFHHGQTEEVLKEILAASGIQEITGAACTVSAPRWLTCSSRIDNQVAMIHSMRKLHPDGRELLFAGGEKFGLIRFDEQGNYSCLKQNTSCAAGTGSFLDQQAGRLNLKGIEEFCRIAQTNHDPLPQIASRCAVFAKTDLIHAQQEGFSLPAICDGLSKGLAKNLADTLFTGQKLQGPLIFCGGVSKNTRVMQYLEELAGIPITTDLMSPFYGAYGAVLDLLDDVPLLENAPFPLEALFGKKEQKEYSYYPPLELHLSTYPDFQSGTNYSSTRTSPLGDFEVEVDLYEELPPNGDYILGVDIGSTSTKAVLLGSDGRVMAGFYTGTLGRPLQAAKGILQTIKQVEQDKDCIIRITGCGTTGSGRKFIGKIIGSDLMLDEITAHARAAYELDTQVDTIIEIGGQDSKFTTLHKGIVTSSIMNSVCAAGTGSFLEEQAKKMGCSVKEYAQRTMSSRAPASSDRCTVFMERDMNHFLNEGCSVDEVLASAIHSVRENYLQKVVGSSPLGKRIYFQGATARNKALVAAFEQKLGQPIQVSRFCHLTGALGVALMLQENPAEKPLFRGIDLFKQDIPVEQEICQLCNNQCKISVATVDGEKAAYGFLCGRDYQTQHFVDNNRSGFDMLKARKKVFRVKEKPVADSPYTIGIPAALHLADELPLWEYFFGKLGIATVNSEKMKDPVKLGKVHSEAEFCAPVSAWHGHVLYLKDKADYLFLPLYLERKEDGKNQARRFCYYTQYAPSLAHCRWKQNRILNPLLKYTYSQFYTKTELYRMLLELPGEAISYLKVSAAYDEALEYFQQRKESLKELYTPIEEDIQVVLLGRPYTLLSPAMNKGIPELFAAQGIRAYTSEMLPDYPLKLDRLNIMREEIHWSLAAGIMETAQKVAAMDGVYPVLVTSFKCSPDSFIRNYFKGFLESQNKPYLILELDEHDSSVGYETRIEAAVRAFRNHASFTEKREKKSKVFQPQYTRKLNGKTLLLPNWDPVSCRFLSAILNREGIDTRVLDETDEIIRDSLKHNTGQCIPLNAVTQGAMEYIRRKGLNPAKTALWMARTNLSCNIPLYPYQIQTILQEEGKGMEKVEGYIGRFDFLDFSPKVSLNAYLAFLFTGYIRRMSCRIRPYEIHSGETDRAREKSIAIIEEMFRGDRNRDEALDEIIPLFESIETSYNEKPKVAIFGDFYVRDNPVMNQDLIRFIEANGGEVITTPYSEYAKIIAEAHFRRIIKKKRYATYLMQKPLLKLMTRMEQSFSKRFNRVLKDPLFTYSTQEEEEAMFQLFGMRLEHSGESAENLLKIFYLKRNFPEISLFVQTSPAFCCPGLVTEAMASRIEEVTEVPVISITYDGTGGNKNEAIVPYLRFPRKGSKRSGETDRQGEMIV